MALNVVIMAAGKGTRMKSARPKVLHHLAGRALLEHVLDTAHGLGASGGTAGDGPAAPVHVVVVTGFEAQQVQACVGPRGQCVRQEPQLGTGHAVQQAVPALQAAAPVTLVLNGDVPLVRTDTARALVQACAGERLALLTVRLDDPTGYGRILRDAQDRVQGIVEHKDASEEQRRIDEVYTGILAAPTA